jgi:hypothetical protein
MAVNQSDKTVFGMPVSCTTITLSLASCNLSKRPLDLEETKAPCYITAPNLKAHVALKHR